MDKLVILANLRSPSLSCSILCSVSSLPPTELRFLPLLSPTYVCFIYLLQKLLLITPVDKDRKHRNLGLCFGLVATQLHNWPLPHPDLDAPGAFKVHHVFIGGKRVGFSDAREGVAQLVTSLQNWTEPTTVKKRLEQVELQKSNWKS